MLKKHLQEACEVASAFLAECRISDTFTEKDVVSAILHIADLFREVDREMPEKSKLKEVAIFQ